MKYLSRRICYILLLIFYWPCLIFSQQAYYISSEHGNDLNSGTSPGTAWQNFSKLNDIASSLSAGTTIYLECNSVWYNSTLNLVNISGTESDPILFTSYGTGKSPEIRGSIIIEGFERSGNIWTITDEDFPDRNADMKNIAGVYINNVFCPIGRTPNEGYYTTSSRGSKTSLTDNNNSWPKNHWQGGQLFARTVSWSWDNSYISGYSSDDQRFTLEGFYYTLNKEETYYFIQNHPNTLDQEFEWAYNDNTLSVYYSNNLNIQKVEIPVIENIFNIENCSNIVFENIALRMTNLHGVNIRNSSGIEFNHCLFTNIGGAGVKAFRTAMNITHSKMYDCFSQSILLDECYEIRVEHNEFKRCGIYTGIANGGRNRAAISSYVAYDPLTVQYNTFDSVMIAYQGHYSQTNMYFRYNVIDDYGMVLGDHGAIYLEGESMGSYEKHVKNNIILNAHASEESITSRGPDTYPHAIYLDYDCANVLIDSNTIVNCNLAFYYNRVRRNTVTNSNIFNPALHLDGIWRTTLFWNAAVGVNFEFIDLNVFQNNTVTHSYLGSDVDITLHNMYFPADGGASGLRDNRMNDNTFIYPFQDNNHIARTVQDYSGYQEYSLSEWQSFSGWDQGSSHGHSSCKYSAALGVSEAEFAKIYYNPTNKPYYQPLSAKYVDKHGAVYDRGITIPPYYSVTLFYHEPTDFPNQSPIILDQSFGVYEQNPQPEYVGTIIATDPDPGQLVNFEIVSGNLNNTFRIDPGSGDIYLNLYNPDFHTHPEFELTIRASDNGIPQQYADATITINLYKDTENHPPIINDQVFEVHYNTLLPANIGQVIATDNNSWQTLKYSIISGNSANNFVLFESTGMLIFRSNLQELPDGAYNINVRVTDNGSPQSYDDGTITINISRDYTNQPPLLEDQSFYYIEDHNASEHIGFIVANDPEGDSLFFEIASSSNNIIELNPNTGELSLPEDHPSIDIEEIVLSVNVYDNGIPSQNSSATIVIHITPSSHIQYIDPSKTTEGDGTYSNPFNSLDSVVFQEGYVYLLKKNTTLRINDNIDINSDHITLSSYGTGSMPIISTSSFNYILKINDHNDITIKNIQLTGLQSLGGIYLIGPLTDNISIRNCVIKNTDYGIRAINVGNVTVEHCRLSSNFNGIFNISRSLKANYNVITNNAIGIRLVSVTDYSNVFNNVFDNNDVAISNETVNTNLYNNIFQLSTSQSKAIKSTVNYYADFNLYHPIKSGFISIDNKNYNSLQELQELNNADFSSLDMNPQFNDAAIGDYSLKQNSPAIDAGVYLGLLMDIEGNPVPHGNAPDIGVIETNGQFTMIEEEAAIDTNSDVSVYPNPATSNLTVSFRTITNENYTLELINTMGKVVLFKNAFISSGNQTLSLNLENATPGMYILKITNIHQVISNKIIVQ